jgi:hypothetical protein
VPYLPVVLEAGGEQDESFEYRHGEPRVQRLHFQAGGGDATGLGQW